MNITKYFSVHGNVLFKTFFGLFIWYCGETSPLGYADSLLKLLHIDYWFCIINNVFTNIFPREVRCYMTLFNKSFLNTTFTSLKISFWQQVGNDVLEQTMMSAPLTAHTAVLSYNRTQIPSLFWSLCCHNIDIHLCCNLKPLMPAGINQNESGMWNKRVCVWLEARARVWRKSNCVFLFLETRLFSITLEKWIFIGLY